MTRTDVFKPDLEPYRGPTAISATATVGEIMSRGVIVLRPDERVFTAIALMVER